ncbi:MAG: VTT domain-containing protein [Xanthobacteraceae bacterium]|nr:VTT domain-containing protein [Xanthobacteraceae bacterium]
MQNSDEAIRPRRLVLALRYLPLVALLAAATVVFSLGLHRHISLEAAVRNSEFLDRIVDENPLKAFAIYVAVYSAAIACATPGAVVFTMFGGLLFGWFFGALGGILGSTIGGVITVLIGSASLGESLRRAELPRFRRLAEGFRNGAFGYIALLRLIPAVPYIVINVASGLFRVPLKTFIAATMIGIAPIAFCFGFIGSGLDQGLEKQLQAFRACEAANLSECKIEFDFTHFLSRELIVGLLLFAVLVALPIVFRKRIAKFRRSARAAQAKPRSSAN